MLHKQLPSTGIRVYALDTTLWPHPRARTLHGLVYDYNATLSKGQTVISKAHVYSGLCWIPQRKGSWALPLSMRRLPVTSTAVMMGVAQVKQYIRQRGTVSDDVVDIIASDGHYGTHLYLSAFKDVPQLGAVTRLRCDRVLLGPPPAYGGRGRPPVHGDRFTFKDSETWWEPDEQIAFEDVYHGQVQLQAWHNLHAKQDASTPFTVIRAQIHQERTVKKRPKAIWLAYIGPELDIRKVWECFDHRWAIEPQFRFRKQQLHWTLPLFQLAQRCDRWSQLVDLAYWQLYLARDIVADQPRPWQSSLELLTPGRVLQSFGQLFCRLNSPAPLPNVAENRRVGSKASDEAKGRSENRQNVAQNGVKQPEFGLNSIVNVHFRAGSEANADLALSKVEIFREVQMYTNEQTLPYQRSLLAFLPNLLAICRMAGGLLYLVKGTVPASPMQIILLCLLAASDLVDGWLARKIGVTTNTGAILDSTSDKVFVISLFLKLSLVKVLSLWLFILICIQFSVIALLGFIHTKRLATVPSPSIAARVAAVLSTSLVLIGIMFSEPITTNFLCVIVAIANLGHIVSRLPLPQEQAFPTT